MLVGLKKDLQGLRIHGVDGDIGKIEEFYFDGTEWVVRYGIVQTGTWMDTHKIRVPAESLRKIDWEQRVVATKWTKAQAEGGAQVHTDRPLIRQDEVDPATHAANPALRSSAAVVGSQLVAADGALGKVVDCMVDPSTWIIHYLAVDVSGEPLLIVPEWISRIDWEHANVHVDMTSEQIKASPELLSQHQDLP